MRAAALCLPLLLAQLAACAARPVTAPSLAPRAAETIDPRVPVVAPATAARPDPQLVQRLDSLVAQALAADQAFRAAVDQARSLAAAAGPRESESWVVAQQALSAAIATRAPVTRAIGDIDALGAERVKASGGIGAANLAAIEAAAGRVGEIDEREAAAISEVQASLAR